MKKTKLTVIVVAVLCLSFMLSACGDKTTNTSNSDSESTSDENSGETSDTMTVSEMLNAVLKDNGGKMYIYTESESRNEEAVGKDLRIRAYSYDGGTVVNQDEPNNLTLGDIAKGGVTLKDYDGGNVKTSGINLDVQTDATGNNVNLELMAYKPESSSGATPYGDGIQFYFGSFSRIQIYDKSFMCFTTIHPEEWGNGNGYTTYYYQLYTIIEDTDSTKDKTIVWDSVGTDGVLIDERDVNPENYYASTPAG